MPLEVSQLVRKQIGHPRIVIVEERDIWRPRRAQGDVACRPGTARCGCRYVFEPAVERPQQLANFRPAPRAVVDNDDLEGGERLSRDGSQGTLQVWMCVTRGDNDGNDRLVHGCSQLT